VLRIKFLFSLTDQFKNGLSCFSKMTHSTKSDFKKSFLKREFIKELRGEFFQVDSVELVLYKINFCSLLNVF